MPEIVQEIGAVAGLAAVVGLAVLSVLYFSQARDVKRLREWAGRAPERAPDLGAQQAPVPAVQAQPQPKPGVPVAGGAAAVTAGQAAAGPKPAQAPQPAGAPKPAPPLPQPAPAAKAGAPQPAATAKPGAPQPGQPQPAEAASAGQAEPQAERAAAGGSDQKPPEVAPKPEGPGAPARPGVAAIAAAAGASASAATQTKPPQAPPAREAGAADPARPGGGPPAPGRGGPPPAPGGPATPAGGRPPGAPPVPPVPPEGRSPVRPVLPPRPMPQQTAIIPPPRLPWYRRLLASPRYLVLAVAGLLIVGGAAAFGVTQLSSDDGGAPAASPVAPAGEREQAESERPRRRRPVAPARVTVAVLNGTTVPGLAKRVGDEVESLGFQLGTVANTADQEQQRAESVVLYAPGHERDARAVNGRLGIAQRQPIDPGSQELAGDATVVVIAGGDLVQ